MQEQRKLQRLKLDHENVATMKMRQVRFLAASRALVARPKCGGGRNLSHKLFIIYECGKKSSWQASTQSIQTRGKQ